MALQKMYHVTSYFTDYTEDGEKLTDVGAGSFKYECALKYYYECLMKREEEGDGFVVWYESMEDESLWEARPEDEEDGEYWDEEPEDEEDDDDCGAA